MKKKTKKIVGTTIAIVMTFALIVPPFSAMGESTEVTGAETIGTDNPTDTTQEDLIAQQQAKNQRIAAEKKAAKLKKLNKAKRKHLKKIRKGYKSWKSYMTDNQKKSFKVKIKKIKKAKKISTIMVKHKKIKKIFKKAKAYKREHSYGNKVGVSCYGPYEGECTTATGHAITNGTYYVAVPISRIVSYSSWKTKSQKDKRHYFYYHEKVYLKNSSRTCIAYVEDCGGFEYMKSYGYYRLFDLTPAVFHKLGISGIGTVTWHY